MKTQVNTTQKKKKNKSKQSTKKRIKTKSIWVTQNYTKIEFDLKLKPDA